MEIVIDKKMTLKDFLENIADVSIIDDTKVYIITNQQFVIKPNGDIVLIETLKSND